MCGRYMITSPFEAMAGLFDATLAEGLGPDAPRPNVSPTQTVPVVVPGPDGRLIVPMRWGFLPHWYREPGAGPLLINARAETIAEKPAFRAAVRERRCLVPADGFYEWTGEKGRKVPHVIRPAAGGLIAFAGIWQDWGRDAARGPTMAIVTCAANDRLAAVHDRMPVVIAPGDFALWLGEEGPGAAALMRPAPEEALMVEEADPPTRERLRRRA
jgi:putative SOS response-associated peptidase YedK